MGKILDSVCVSRGFKSRLNTYKVSRLGLLWELNDITLVTNT